MRFKTIGILALILTSCGQSGSNSGSNKHRPDTPAPETPIDKTSKAVQAGPAGAWIAKNRPWLLADSDPNHKIYQLKVLNQKYNECTLHQKRNLFFHQQMISGTYSNFDAVYSKMISSDLFEEMMLKTVVTLYNKNAPNVEVETRKPDVNERRIRRYPNIHKFLREESDFAKFLPEKSRDYLPQILKSTKYTNGQDYKNIYAFAKVQLPASDVDQAHPQFQHEDSSDLTKMYYGWLNGSANILQFYNAVQKHSKAKTSVLPVALSLNSTGTILHAASMMISKSPKGTETFFMDPLNWRFSERPTYLNRIHSIQRLTSDLNYLGRSIIRSAYITSAKAHAERHPDVNYSPTETYEAYKIFQNLKLNDQPLYKQIYREKFCDIIQEYPAGRSLLINKVRNNSTGAVTGTDVDNYRHDLKQKFQCQFN